MAAPGDCLSAHDRGAFFEGYLFKLRKCISKCFCAHVVGVSSKGEIPPAGIRRIFVCCSPAAERLHPLVLDPGFFKGSAKRFLLKLRVMARVGNRADVSEELNIVSRKESDEIFNRAGGVANGVYLACHRAIVPFRVLKRESRPIL